MASTRRRTRIFGLTLLVLSLGGMALRAEGARGGSAVQMGPESRGLAGPVAIPNPGMMVGEAGLEPATVP